MGRAYLPILAAAVVLATPVGAHAQIRDGVTREVTAAEPHDLSVTVYRSPNRGDGGFDLNQLEGFALITETRRVTLPAGESRLRFEGVADGIEAVSAIVTGLPDGVVEKNRDAALISPSALIEAAQAQGGRVLLSRSKPGSGATTRTEGVIRSGADGGVVFETPDGIEALRCSGLSETFGFESATTGLSARPTLSVLTRTTRPVEAVVQLSYISYGFDWAADYVANAQPGGKIDLGAWITLANGNGTSFPNARVQIVAGRLNKETGEVEPIDIGRPILARCWPQGSTSDPSPPITIERAYPLGFDPNRFPVPMPAPMASMAPSAREFMQDNIVVTGSKMAEQEDLGDLKLYRVPDRVTVASRQSKQVRMMDRAGVTVARLYEADLWAYDAMDGYEPAIAMLRTRNDEKNKLGLPLPSGRLALFEPVGSGANARRLLAGEAPVRDLAVNEEVEFRFDGGTDVQVRQVTEIRQADDPPLPFLPGFNRRNAPDRQLDEEGRIELSNARPYPVQVEVRLQLDDVQKVIKASHPVAQKNGRPIFRVTVSANSALVIRYQTSSR